MTRHQLIFSGLLVGAIGVAAASGDVLATDYVLARSPWGTGSWGRNYGSASNGYGGYFVPRDAPGNNYEGRGQFTNPNGYIIPASSGNGSTVQTKQSHFFRRRWR